MNDRYRDSVASMIEQMAVFNSQSALFLADPTSAAKAFADSIKYTMVASLVRSGVVPVEKALAFLEKSE